MPRTGRVVVPNTPHHVVQRGHNRQAVFATEDDFHRYLEDLREVKQAFNVRVYAYCLMTNHVHLLLVPGESAESMAKLMKTLAGRATRRRNRQEGRTGTLWEGRYKSSPVETDRYLLACCRYIELNPVRAGMVSRVEDYRWSSFRQRMGLVDDNWLDADPCYLALSDCPVERRRRYRNFVGEAIPDGEANLIRLALQRGQLTGGQGLRDETERILGRRVIFRGRGRPRTE